MTWAVRDRVNNILLFQPVDGGAAFGGAPPPAVVGEEPPIAQVNYFSRTFGGKGFANQSKETFLLVKIEDLKHYKNFQPFILLPILNLGEHAVAPAPGDHVRLRNVGLGRWRQVHPRGGFHAVNTFILVEACACFL
jgi:hypothetical protein